MPLLMQYLSLVGARLVLLAIDNIAQRLAPKPAAPKPEPKEGTEWEMNTPGN